MPSSRLLANDAVGSLQSLGVLLTNDVNGLGRQNTLVASPIICIPKLTARFPLRVGDQFSQKLIGMLAHSRAED